MTKGNAKFLSENETEDGNGEWFLPVYDVDFKADVTSSAQPNKLISINAASRCIIKRSQINVGGNAARERTRVQQLKEAFNKLQQALPNVPEGTKLSKLDILLLATNHISHLMSKLSQGYVEEHRKRLKDKGVLHPIKVTKNNCLDISF